jgi:hypothetical protein
MAIAYDSPSSGCVTFSDDKNILPDEILQPGYDQTEFERLALKFHPAVPDWAQFKSAFLSPPDEDWEAIPALLASSNMLALFYGALEALAENGGEHETATVYWQKVLEDVNLTSQQVGVIKARAAACNLPASFIFYLEGVPAPVEVGQEWIDSAGSRWRVIQRSNSDGSFAEDNPITKERESLEWAKVAED